MMMSLSADHPTDWRIDRWMNEPSNEGRRTFVIIIIMQAKPPSSWTCCSLSGGLDEDDDDGGTRIQSIHPSIHVVHVCMDAMCTYDWCKAGVENRQQRIHSVNILWYISFISNVVVPLFSRIRSRYTILFPRQYAIGTYVRMCRKYLHAYAVSTRNERGQKLFPLQLFRRK